MALPNWAEKSDDRRSPALPGRRYLVPTFVLASLVATVLAARQSVSDTRRFPGFDYRMVAVAARAMNAGYDPYRTQLTTGPDGRPLRPAVPLAAYNRLTFVPPLLSLHGLLADLPYLQQRYAWLAGSWAAFAVALGSVVLLQRSAAERLFVFGVGVWFFAVSDFWRRHLIQGKYYVLLTALMAVGAWLLARRGRRSWAAGVPFGLAVALRPTIGLAVVVLWLTGRRPAALATVAVAALASAASLANVPASAWPDSFAAVRVAGREIATGWQAAPPEFVTGPVAADLRVDASFPDAEAEITAVPWQNLTFARAVLRPLYRAVGRPGPAAWHGFSQAAALAWVAGGIVLLWLARPGRLPRRLVALHIVVLATGVDFFMPDRYTYTDVMYLLPFGLAVPLLSRPSAPGWVAAALLAGLTLGHDRLVPSEAYWVAEVRMAGLLFAPACLVGWALLRRRRPHRASLTPAAERVLRITAAAPTFR
ncbi:MAG: hypothetical protein JWO31_3752 [Phycisphaerales bacterium]|nr:hypothetical protein [Phycisphaerales bacterium]